MSNSIGPMVSKAMTRINCSCIQDISSSNSDYLIQSRYFSLSFFSVTKFGNFLRFIHHLFLKFKNQWFIKCEVKTVFCSRLLGFFGLYSSCQNFKKFKLCTLVRLKHKSRVCHPKQNIPLRPNNNQMQFINTFYK